MQDTAHFGFAEIPAAEKAARVGGVFTAVADKYDTMNDLMSFGVHRWWKKFAAARSGLRPGDTALDVAAGGGDMANLLAAQVGPRGAVLLADINAAMLARGKRNMTDRGRVQNIHYVLTDAEKLGVANDYFDCVCIAFGLRNVTRMHDALTAMHRAVKPGGRLLVLEFSKPVLPLLEKIYDLYSFHMIPRLGACVAGDEQSYRYLVESIRRHPAQNELKSMLQTAGFENVRMHNLSGGIVALHIGFKF